jgi:hypothetical protein
LGQALLARKGDDGQAQRHARAKARETADAANASSSAERDSYLFVADQWEKLVAGFPGLSRRSARTRGNGSAH